MNPKDLLDKNGNISSRKLAGLSEIDRKNLKEIDEDTVEFGIVER